MIEPPSLNEKKLLIIIKIIVLKYMLYLQTLGLAKM